MQDETFSTLEALRFGWGTFKRNLGRSVGLAAAVLVAMGLSNWLADVTQRYDSLALGFTVLTQLVQTLAAFVWIRFALATHDARVVTPRELVPDGLTFINYLAVTILYGLLVSAGLLLLVIPGLYVAVRYGMVGFLVADRRAEVLAAFRESAEVTRGARWRLFAFGLTLLLLNLVGAIAFGLGLLVTLPVSAFASALVYRRLEARAERARVVSGSWAVPA